MRKGKNELIRIQSMIENDRVCVGDDFLDLIEKDLIKLLRDYFDFSSSPKVRIEAQNNSYCFSFNINVSRIKNFANMLKENIDNF